MMGELDLLKRNISSVVNVFIGGGIHRNKFYGNSKVEIGEKSKKKLRTN